MNTRETGALLAMCAGYDNREASELQLRAWAEGLEAVDFGKAQEAVKDHYLVALNPHRITVTDILLFVKLSRRPSHPERLHAAIEAMKAVEACDLCDDRGYRLPASLVLCKHSEVRTIGAAAQVRRMLEAGEAS